MWLIEEYLISIAVIIIIMDLANYSIIIEYTLFINIA